MNTENTPPPSSWPFPAAGHFRRSAASRNTGQTPPPDDGHDPVEQELVDEQLEHDRKATKAVDSKIPDGDND